MSVVDFSHLRASRETGRRGQPTAHLLRSWAPVVLALLVAAGAGWAIMALHTNAERAGHARERVAAMQIDLEGPEGLLLSGTGTTAAPAPGATFHAVNFQSENLRALAALRTTGDPHLVDTVTHDIRIMAHAQDVLAAGGAAAARTKPSARPIVAALRGALADLLSSQTAAARMASRLSDGGTMGIMLVAALLVIVLLRRFDRMRRRLTAELHVQATHDPLTSLANRRKLADDLATAAREATAERPARLALFDLDGFKGYNDRFGHQGGDLLLTRLSCELMKAVGTHATAYRLGGDEFCVLLRGDDSETVIQACRSALSTEGSGFAITCSYGAVLMPVETKEPDVALQVADQRMYAHKDSGRASAGQQTRDLALKVLATNEPDVRAHSVLVATLVERVSRRLGLADTELADTVRAAELHDIGKIAIPFAVLHKPGPLDDEEWELMRTHVSIGANILTAAPALAHVAEIVRSTHERYDGSGYPNGLAREQIPLPSRIVFVCDAFDAMISERPYAPALTTALALAELRRNAGTQFDPAVVDAFSAELAQPATAADVAPAATIGDAQIRFPTPA